jgi:phosphinothricin acetyltransferase
MIEVRTARPEDATAILGIYAPYIHNTVFTFETEVPSVEDFSRRITNCLDRFPWLVLTVNGKVEGYAYASAYRDRAAYQWSCECSIYFGKVLKGKGAGFHLYQALFRILQWQGIRNVYAVITLPNEPSVRLHQKCGFQYLVTYDNVGYKGGWQKVGWWSLRLNDFIPDPPPPVKFSQLDEQKVHQLLGETTAMLSSISG